MKKWSEIKDEFELDGTLRDIIAENTNPEIWNIFIKKLQKSSYRLEFTHGDSTKNIPESYEQIKKLQNTDPTTLFIWLNETIQANCHFFIDSEIEIDVSPHDITNEQNFLTLAAFLKWLSKAVCTRVSLTHEASPDLEILSFDNGVSA